MPILEKRIVCAPTNFLPSSPSPWVAAPGSISRARLDGVAQRLHHVGPDHLLDDDGAVALHHLHELVDRCIAGQAIETHRGSLPLQTTPLPRLRPIHAAMSENRQIVIASLPRRALSGISIMGVWRLRAAT